MFFHNNLSDITWIGYLLAMGRETNFTILVKVEQLRSALNFLDEKSNETTNDKMLANKT